MFQKSVKKSALKSAQKSSYPFKSTQNSAQKSSFPQKSAQKSTLKSTFGSSESIWSCDECEQSALNQCPNINAHAFSLSPSWFPIQPIQINTLNTDSPTSQLKKTQNLDLCNFRVICVNIS